MTHRSSVFDRLKPRRNLLPLIVPEIMIASSRGHNQMCIFHRPFVSQHDAPVLRIETHCLVQQYKCIAIPAQ